MTPPHETIERLQSENAALRQRLADIEQSVVAHQQNNYHTDGEGMYRILFEQSGDAMFLLGEKAFLECNQASLDLMHCDDKGSIVGHHPSEFSPEHQPDGRPSSEKAQELITRAFNGEDMRFDWIHRRCDGEMIPTEVTLSRIMVDGVPLIFGSWRDVTERNRIEAELQQWNERLEQRIAEQTETLRQNQQLLQGIIDNVPAIVYAKDREGRYVLVNEPGAAMVGKERSEILGNTDADILPAEVARRFQHKDQQVFSSGEVLKEEETIQHPDGARTYLALGFPLCDDAGTIYAVGGVSTDITERKVIEEQLTDSENRYRTLIENLQDGVFIIKQATFLYVNQVFARMIGYTLEDLVGRAITEVIAPEDLAMVMDRYTRRLRGEDVSKIYEFRMLHRDGLTRIWVNMSVDAITYQGQNVSMGTVEDITERKQTEEDLRMFKVLVENAPDAFAIATIDGIIIYVNHAYRQLLGYGEDSVGMLISDFYPPDNQEELMTIVQDIHEHGTWQGELLHQQQDGTTFPALVSGIMIYDNEGQPQAIAAIIRDVRQQREDERERALLQQQIIQTQRDAIRELSTPLIPLSHHVVMMPLIGTIDSTRAQQIMETLLEGIAHYQADIAIVDITGVSVLDTQVANVLIQAAHAVRLLGAQVVLTGIGPSMAQTLVHLGTDLSAIITRGNLQHGIAYAFQSTADTLWHNRSNQ
jgi:rsbT co-antagonist protein RsbR